MKTRRRTRARASVVPTESAEQASVIQWWVAYARTKGLDERLLFSVPNGSVLAGDARRRGIQMARLKREGLRPGVPDLMLARPKYSGLPGASTGLFAGLFVEMKRRGGKPSKHQVEYADLLRRSGYNVVIAQGFDEAVRAIRAYIMI